MVNQIKGPYCVAPDKPVKKLRKSEYIKVKEQTNKTEILSN